MSNTKSNEIWVTSPDGQRMCALINGNYGWLMYLRTEEDSGFSSRNPGYNGPSNATIAYVLANGQIDEYPASWALPMSDIQRALDYFREHNRPPPFVTWNNDSGDGSIITTPS